MPTYQSHTLRARITSVLSIMAFLALAIPAWADGLVAKLTVNTNALSCNGTENGDLKFSFQNSTLTGSDSNSCDIPMVGTFNVLVTASAQPFSQPNGQFDTVSAYANTSGPGVAGLADATSSEEVTITPPPGSLDRSATVQAGDSYSISIQGAGGSGGLRAANASVGIVFDPVFGSPVSAGQAETTNGDFSGSLLTPDLTAFGCPCSFLFTLDASASAGNGAFSQANDPGPFLLLPSGWTYTFSAPPAPVPEPGTLALFGSGLVSLVARRRWRLRQDP